MVGNRDVHVYISVICPLYPLSDFPSGVKLGFVSSGSKSTHTRTLKQGLAWMGGLLLPY